MDSSDLCSCSEHYRNCLNIFIRALQTAPIRHLCTEALRYFSFSSSLFKASHKALAEWPQVKLCPLVTIFTTVPLMASEIMPIRNDFYDSFINSKVDGKLKIMRAEVTFSKSTLVHVRSTFFKQASELEKDF